METMSLGKAIGDATGAVVNDQVGYFTDMKLWKIRIFGFIGSILLGIIVHHFMAQDCGDATGCTPVNATCQCDDTKNTNNCAEVMSKCMEDVQKQKNEQTPECTKALQCTGKALLWGFGSFFVGMLVTFLLNMETAIQDGHGRAVVEQMVLNAVFNND
jgi:hypothetical protein